MANQQIDPNKSPALRQKEGATAEQAVLPKPIEATAISAPSTNPNGMFGGHALEGTLKMPAVSRVPYTNIDSVNIYGGAKAISTFEDYVRVGHNDPNRTAAEKQVQLNNVQKLFAAIPADRLGTPEEAQQLQQALNDGSLSEQEVKQLPEKVFVMQLVGPEGKQSVPGLVSITHPSEPIIKRPPPKIPTFEGGTIKPVNVDLKLEKVPVAAVGTGPKNSLPLEFRAMAVMGADGKVAPGIKAVYLTGGAADLTLAVNQFAQTNDHQTFNRNRLSGSVEQNGAQGTSIRAGMEKMLNKNFGLGVDAGANIYNRNSVKFPNSNTLTVNTNGIAVEPTVGATALLKTKGVTFGLGGQFAKSQNTFHVEVGTSVDNFAKFLGLK